MNKQEAIDLLRKHSEELAESWSMSPEGREYKTKFDSAVDALAGVCAPVEYGCHCDLEPGQAPDGCVLDKGRAHDCVLAERLIENGQGRNDCAEWRRIEVRPNNRLDGACKV